MTFRIASSFFVLLLCFAPSAKAYNFGSPLSTGCHEEISLEALSHTGWPVEVRASPLEGALTHASRDLPFDVAGTTDDAWTLALVLGVRFNDLHGAAATDLVSLSDIHGAAEQQREHCLRAKADDGSEGDATAIAACREFIRSEIVLALGDGDQIDSAATTVAPVALAYSGHQDLALAAFPFHLGRALHALQDSYTHTFRTEDLLRIRSVLNFADWARGHDYSVARDGHRHLSVLDQCELDTAPARSRRAAATEASRALFEALRDSGDRARRLERVDAVLDTYLTIEPGCDAQNNFCDAPERSEAESACSVVAVGARASDRGWWVACVAFMCLLLLSRRSFAVALLCVVSLINTAKAEDATTAAVVAASPAPAPVHGRFSIIGTVSASLDNGAFAERIGVRYRVTDLIEVGVDAEHNPWYSLEALSVIPGAFNTSAIVLFHWVTFDRFELRSTLAVGASVLLVDLVAARAGSVGPYFGVSLLGLSYALSDRLKLVVDPADVAVPIPHVVGVPFLYQQYRFTIGVQWAL